MKKTARKLYKTAPENSPSNLKKSRQNIDEIGRTSAGGPRERLNSPFKPKKTSKLKEAMKVLSGE